jgi:transposase-like protein
MSFPDLMNTELLSPELEVESQEIEEDEEVMENMQQEIECPRCTDIMTLSSEFDKMLYFCQECELSLVMK